MRFVAALLVALVALPAAACGADENARPKQLYEDYRAADARRDEAEGRLRQAISDLAGAADRRDRPSALAAIARGRVAAAEIERLLTEEIRAAHAIRRYPRFARDAARLEHGLRASREGVRLFARELEIGATDPYLDRKANSQEVNRLAREGGQRSVDGEVEARRPSRALALALGVEPSFDPLVERES